jgi:hypothetical protein
MKKKIIQRAGAGRHSMFSNPKSWLGAKLRI